MYLTVWLSLVGLTLGHPTPSDLPVKRGFSVPLRRGDENGPFDKRSNTASASAGNKWWFTLGIGTPPQDIDFLGDSAADITFVSSTLANGELQTDAILYDPSKSSTAVLMQGYSFRECFTGNCFYGPYYEETITIGGQVFTNIPMGATNHSDNPIGNGDRSGNCGLAPDPNGQGSTPAGVPLFMQALSSQLPQDTVAFTYDWDLNTGQIDFGFVDSSKYTNGMTYVNTAPGTGVWQVHFDGMVVNGQLVSIPFDGVIDTGTSSGTIPRPALDAYFAQIPTSYFDSSANTYQFPCNAQLPDMVFSIGLYELAVPPATWIGTPVDGANTCLCAFTADSSNSSAFLGFTWIAGVYVVFDLANLRVGLANRTALSTTVPSYSPAGNIHLCTGANFAGTCTEAPWTSNTCENLGYTPYFQNVGSFSPSVGYCTLYQDAHCASPLPYASGVEAPGLSNTYGSGPLTQAYACFYPSDYPIRGSGNFTVCTEDGSLGNCDTTSWSSFECHNLPSGFSKNFLSATVTEGYCYLFLNQGCTGPVENGAPFVNGGPGTTPIGQEVQSFMCL